MAFEYVWGALETQGDPPNGEIFSMLSGEYKFFPFSYKGKIFTFDSLIWNNGKGKDSKNILWPSNKQIESIILGDEKSKFLVALVNEECAPTIKQDESVKLHKIPLSLHAHFLKNFYEYGYDVVDLSGISALTNVGYKSEDLHLFENIRINEYGLVPNSDEAIKISKIASRVSPEHGPFFPVVLWGARMPRI